MATVTPLRAGDGPVKNRGTFYAEQFSMFDDADLARYAEFRNRAADQSNGIDIELMREYARKTTTTEEMEGGPRITTNTEEIILVIHYWQKTPSRSKGDSDDENQRDWNIIRPSKP